MDEAARKKVIAKIRKLLAIAESGKGDAANAADLATRMMTKYQIDSVSEELDQDPIDDNVDLYIELTKSKRIPWWKWELAWKVAGNASCKPYKLERRHGSEIKGSGISFIGRRSDAQLCCYLFSYLVRELERIRKERLPRSGNKIRQYIPGSSPVVVDSAYQRQWSRDFYAGAISRLEIRMAHARRDVMAGVWSDCEHDSVPNAPSATALARIDRIIQEVDQKARDMGLSYESAPSHRIMTPEGWTQGIRAGNEVDLSTDHRALGEGLVQLPARTKSL